MLREEANDIREGILVCSHQGCRCEYPIIDGIPIIVADIRTFVAQSVAPLLTRDDLSAEIESLIGDCCGAGSPYDARRLHLSTYAFDHYGDLDPEMRDADGGLPGSVLRIQRRGLEALPSGVPSGPVLDVGCAVGRTTFELAAARHEMTLGIDLNFDMLAMASRALHEGAVRYPRRRVGMAYDRREFAIEIEGRDLVDFWACDAMALPLAKGVFSLASTLNVLDCVSSPYDHLSALSRVLAPGAAAIICTPYDWSASATPVQSWLGGHSQRSESRGASEPMLRSLLAGDHPQAIEGLEVVAEFEDVPWSVRMHDRSVMHYRVHLLVVKSV